MPKKNTNVLIIAALVLLIIAGGWYFVTQKRGEEAQKSEFIAGPKAQAELVLLGYSAMADLDALAPNFPDGARYVKSIKDALAVLDTPTAKEEDLVEAHLTIGVGLKTLKNLDGAVKEYEEILKINEKHSIALNNLAQIYLEREDYPKAEEYFKKLIVASPTWFQAYTDLADLYRAYLPEKKKEIPGIIQQGLKESPNHVSFMVYLGEFYEAEKDKKNAARYYGEALKADPNNTDAKDGLARTKN